MKIQLYVYWQPAFDALQAQWIDFALAGALLLVWGAWRWQRSRRWHNMIFIRETDFVVGLNSR